MIIFLLIATFVQEGKGICEFLVRRNCFLAIPFCVIAADFSGFLESPQPSLSSLLASASFSCSVISSEVTELLWEVDGGQTSSKSYAIKLRERGLEWRHYQDNERSSLELTVLASEENNGTGIVCVAFTVSDGIQKTSPVYLYAYGTYAFFMQHHVLWEQLYDCCGLLCYNLSHSCTGHPSAPGMLSLTPIPPGQLYLTWSQPYSPPTVMLSYTVTITELDSVTKAVVGQPNSVMVENSTTYIFAPPVQSCNEYIFTVQAENEAGTSDFSKAISDTLPIGEILPFCCTIMHLSGMSMILFHVPQSQT